MPASFAPSSRALLTLSTTTLFPASARHSSSPYSVLSSVSESGAGTITSLSSLSTPPSPFVVASPPPVAASFIMRSCSSAASLGSIAFAKSVPSCRSRLSHHRSFSFVGHWRQELSTHGTAARYGVWRERHESASTPDAKRIGVVAWRGARRVGRGRSRATNRLLLFLSSWQNRNRGGREMMGASRSVGPPFGGAVRRRRPPDNATMRGR
mmetsp:Transcript_33369/g.71100  ORF Transcript_33369/g.71100 Transcript_33369/m.71100 type:complete len:210 (-) Transcript_33369:192-821(-)